MKQFRHFKILLKNNHSEHSLLDDIADTLNCVISDLRLDPYLKITSLLIISRLGNEYSSLEKKKAIHYLIADNKETALTTNEEEKTDE